MCLMKDQGVSAQMLTCVKGTAAVWRMQTHAMMTAAARATRENFIFTSVTLKVVLLLRSWCRGWYLLKWFLCFSFKFTLSSAHDRHCSDIYIELRGRRFSPLTCVTLPISSYTTLETLNSFTCGNYAQCPAWRWMNEWIKQSVNQAINQASNQSKK